MYLLFLPAAVAVYWTTPRHWRVHVLVILSYLFYASWSVGYAALMFVLVVVNWFAAEAARRQDRQRRLILIGAIAVDLGLLVFFKQGSFLWDSTGQALSGIGIGIPESPLRSLVLPLGISFFTFEFVHFLVDSYRGNVPRTSFSEFHVFSAFFPTQIAGPIKRFQDFLPQIGREERLTMPLIIEAMPLLVLGLFKKMALADNLATIADLGFANPTSLTRLEAWAALVAFAFQIYFDFSGYTDIARGSALLLGFRVPMNFNHPYFARSPSDFWDRWHISLSRWLRDYLFIPLGGSRGSRLFTVRNLVLTMLLGGVWHGAGWQFILWGAYWGILLSLHHQWRRLGSYLPPSKVITLGQIAITFALVTIGWCFFRAPTGQLLSMLGALTWNVSTSTIPVLNNVQLGFPLAVAAAYFVYVGLLEQPLRELQSVPRVFPARGLAYAGLLAAAVVAAPHEQVPFIYFQF